MRIALSTHSDCKLLTLIQAWTALGLALTNPRPSLWIPFATHVSTSIAESVGPIPQAVDFLDCFLVSSVSTCASHSAF